MTVETRAGAIAVAARMLGPLAQRDVPLGPLTTYKVGGSAALFVRPASLADLAGVAEASRISGVPVLVVGRGSNMLVADRGFAGIAISVTAISAPDGAGGGELDIEGDGGHPDRVVGAGAGMALPVVARRLAGAGWRGFEWAVGVPGSIGGAVRMNAGGQGSEMAACVVSADVFDLTKGERTMMPVDALDLRFRSSGLGDHHVVLRAALRVRAGSREAAEAELNDIVRWRRENQPGGQNAGSVFVNPIPEQLSAGQLIDQLGLRGFRIGSAAVSDKHANFIQGSDGGSADDVRAVIEAVRERVAAATGFQLRSEVRLVGFPDGSS
ncbi:UDP-N-acetylmuramate dehydrogenase [soil metagenome]